MSSMPGSLTRSVWWAVEVPGAPAPWNVAHLRAFYRAAPTWSLAERMSGSLPAADPGVRRPVVLVVPGINIGQDSYRWLAEALVDAGFVAVTFDLVGELMPGQYGTTPGLDLGAVTPESYGSRPTTPSLRAIHDALAVLDAGDGPLAGQLDLDRVAWVGHSAGGSASLQSSSSQWFPELRAVVAYGCHGGVSTALGWPESTVVESPATVPFLLVGGRRDGVIAGSAVRYGDGDAAEQSLVARTFDESLVSSVDAVLVEFTDATHFTLADPIDPTTARSFLDEEPGPAGDATRELVAATIIDFLRGHVADDEDALARVASLVEAPSAQVARAARRTTKAMDTNTSPAETLVSATVGEE
jgi:predicted dienelactone hydrolase